jgi:hypothetical protein
MRGFSMRRTFVSAPCIRPDALRYEDRSQIALPHRCHAEQREASGIFSGGYKGEIVRLSPQNEITAQPHRGRGNR